MNILKSYAFLGCGGSRAVVDLGNNTVAKIPISLYGVACNRAERNNYNALPKELKKYVAAVVGYENDILIQEKLTDTRIFKYQVTDDEIEAQLLIELDLSKENIDGLNAIRLNNRLQIGKGEDGIYKIFDFACVKCLTDIFGCRPRSEVTAKTWWDYISYLDEQNKSCTDLLYSDWAQL